MRSAAPLALAAAMAAGAIVLSWQHNQDDWYNVEVQGRRKPTPGTTHEVHFQQVEVARYEAADPRVYRINGHQPGEELQFRVRLCADADKGREASEWSSPCEIAVPSADATASPVVASEARTTALELAVSNLQSAVSALTSRLASVEGTLSTAQSNISTAQSNISSLASRVTSLETPTVVVGAPVQGATA